MVAYAKLTGTLVVDDVQCPHPKASEAAEGVRGVGDEAR